jgi:hypothetical protein
LLIYFRFITLLNLHHTEIHATHKKSLELMQQIMNENKLSTKLRKDLLHEKVVLHERREVFVALLTV